MPAKALPPVHPGEILAEEFFKPLGWTAYRASAHLHTSRPRIERLIRGEAPITIDTALRLERLFGASAEFWMNLQTRYDLLVERAKARADLEAIQPAPKVA